MGLFSLFQLEARLGGIRGRPLFAAATEEEFREMRDSIDDCNLWHLVEN